jgi:hypothetical protein
MALVEKAEEGALSEERRFAAWAAFMANPPEGTVFTDTNKWELRAVMDAADNALGAKVGATIEDVKAALAPEYKGTLDAKVPDKLVQDVTAAITAARAKVV